MRHKEKNAVLDLTGCFQTAAGGDLVHRHINVSSPRFIGSANQSAGTSLSPCPCLLLETLQRYKCIVRLFKPQSAVGSSIHQENLPLSFISAKLSHPTMREIVHIQAGQCGNQIGAKVGKQKERDYIDPFMIETKIIFSSHC